MALAAVVLVLNACGRKQPLTAPVPVVEREELGEGPGTIEIEISPPSRDILGETRYDLPIEANSWVEAELDFLVTRRGETLERWMERGAYYQNFVEQELRAVGLPTDLFHLALIESGMLPTARSRAGAVGMWQFMPATARDVGLRVDALVDERMDPVRSTRAAARYLGTLHRVFDDWALAAAAYNAGMGRISRGMKRFSADDFWELAQRGDLAEETRHYVPRLFAMTVVGRDPGRFGLRGADATAATFAFDSIYVEYMTPLEELAKLGPASAEDLQRFNPHLRENLVPEGGYWVWVPQGQGVALQRAYLASDFRKAGGLGIYAVRPGDNLSTLASHAGITVRQLRELNADTDLEPLRIGLRLRLPYHAAQELAARPEAAPSPRAEAASERAAPAEAVHTVASGETLWEIARSYQVTVASLQKANDLAGATIRPGQELKIPSGGKGEEAKVVEHVVQGGDTLWGIARRYGSSVEAIQEANQLGKRPIVPGQTLRIPSGT